MLVGIGVVFLIEELDVFRWFDVWPALLMAVGAAFLVEALLRPALGMDASRTPQRLVVGAVLLALGGAFSIDLHAWWPVVLVVIGLLLVASAVRRGSG